MPVNLNRHARQNDAVARWSDEQAQIQFSRLLGKLTYALPVDGMGDLKPPIGPIGLITTPDEAGGGKDVAPGNPILTVGATPTIATINELGDLDFFQVTLTAGTTYEIGQYSLFGGPNAVNLTDPYMELYAADGTTLIVSADGGANTPYNDINSGFDVLLTYTPDVTGTYYVNARAFSNSPATLDGDSVGDYELFVRVQDPNDPNIYRPYYDVDSPLYAIDWGTQVNKINQSARNPDGNEGTRDTGNEQGTPDYNVNDVPGLDIAALAAAQGKDISGKNVITIYFAQAGDIFVSNDPTNPGLPPATITAVAVQGFERTAVLTSLGEFEKVADVVYLEVTNRDHADFIYTSYQGTPGPGVSLLGSMSPPDESDEGLAQFNSGDYRWNATDLQQGGFSFVTLIHEFGHGHGLAHPHDNGGHSGIMHGVEQETPTSVANYTTGDFDLNQGVFTMMSYEDGWQTSPYGNADTDVGYGYLGGLMAFDIAAIQDKYGVNESYNTGNNVYVMKDVNAAGTYYSSIWDGGGIDAIAYNGARDATIDLRAATLQYEFGGGGRVSFAYGIYGGFTIANGVTIENAYGGSGTDTLFGNEVDNMLNGRTGIDAMTGLGGNDIYIVDNAGDTAVEAAGGGTDIVYSAVSYSLNDASEVESLSTITWQRTDAIDLTGNGLANTLIGNAGVNQLNGAGGADVMFGREGDDSYIVDNVADQPIEYASQGIDTVYSAISYTLFAGTDVEGLAALDFAGTAGLYLTGNELANSVIGNDGGNQIDGGAGADVMVGRGGNDNYLVDNALDKIFEDANTHGGGSDAIYTAVSFALTNDQEIEGLSTLSWQSTHAIDLTGNAANNNIIGNAGSNVLNGGGGNDYMDGKGGADIFQFTALVLAANADVILGFDAADDIIALDDGVFAGLAPGALNPNAFVVGTAAADADDRIIYDNVSGALYFDADGSGSGAAILFAVVAGGPPLSAGDFQII